MTDRESGGVVVFEAALPAENQIALKLKSGGEATLTLQLSHEAAMTLGRALPRLEGRTFAVAINLTSIEELAADVARQEGTDSGS